MKLEIRIDLGNAAFEENKADEVARILREYAADAERGGYMPQKQLRDINGNEVGRAFLKSDA